MKTPPRLLMSGIVQRGFKERLLMTGSFKERLLMTGIVRVFPRTTLNVRNSAIYV